MSNLRIGNGYDVHRLTEGRKLVLGGVHIPFKKGLAGHSDADVLLHAITDALLGSLALGDIGKLFPDTDSEYKDIDSRILLREVKKILEHEGYKVVNLDSTIVAEQPKLSAYIPQMRKNIAADLDISSNRISVKATTSEKLGFEGRGEGISASSVVLIKKE